jgi:DNA polymerase III delta prime subunit
MIDENRKSNFLWVEKYRPQTIEDCILPTELKNTFKEFVENKELPNLILSGGAGIGKTTVAKALCQEMGLDHMLINGSEDGNIDTLRTKIRHYASTVSFSSQGKVVILDEADYLNPQSTQPALRGFIEEFAGNCRFILTCNFRNRIITPLQSRCSVIEFKINKDQENKIMARFMDRTRSILDVENIEYNPKIVSQLIMKYFPDWRRVLNELQRYSAGGVIDEGLLINLNDIKMSDLSKLLKERKFTDMRKWVVDNVDNDPTVIFRAIYDGLYEHINPSSIPQAVVTIADYQYKSAFVADQEINLVACLTELMVECDWK